MVLGASIEEAVEGPRTLGGLLDTWRGRQYALSYRPDTKKVYVVLREGAASADILEAAFHAQHFLHALDRVDGAAPPSLVDGLLRDTAARAPALFTGFTSQAQELGWKLQLTMLNPSETRLRVQLIDE